MLAVWLSLDVAVLVSVLTGILRDARSARAR
jgi:hypothetical protein